MEEDAIPRMEARYIKTSRNPILLANQTGMLDPMGYMALGQNSVLGQVRFLSISL
jgi:hypothetical protein